MDRRVLPFAPALFALVMFLSAALIFLLQPMFARVTTPLLGGSPAVWNTSMVFFQAALLLGYAYAHALVRYVPLPGQVALHGLVLVAAMLVLPIAGADALGSPSTDQPALWLFGVLAVFVGAPYAAASATAPLLQAWYARSGAPDAADPYHLYAASNLGSLLGLLAYPLLVEPLFGLSQQRVLWSGGYVAVAALIIACGVVAVLAARSVPTQTAVSVNDGPALTLRQRLFWIAAAAVPSSLLLGVTHHISTDVASAPFLWVIPLALYLLTFVVAFGKRAEVWQGPVTNLAPLGLALLLAAYSMHNWAVSLIANLVCFVLAALVCHLALAERRPAAGKLTEFYMWVSVGGVVGGALTALVAPVLFTGVYEYPLALAAACLFLVRREDRWTRLGWGLAAAAVGMCLFVGALVLSRQAGGWDWGARSLRAVGIGIALAPLVLIAVDGFGLQLGRSWRIALAVVASILLALGLSGVLSLDFSSAAAWFENTVPLSGHNVVQIAAVLTAAAGAFLLRYGLRGLQPAAAVPAEETAIPDTRRSQLLIWPGLILLILGILLALSLLGNLHFALQVGLALVALGLVVNRARPVLAAGLVVAGFAAAFAVQQSGTILQQRSFFGVVRVEEAALEKTSLRSLLHGTTIHGAQLTGPFSRQPLTYYAPGTANWRESGLPQWGDGLRFANRGTALGIASFRALEQRRPATFGLVGLGSGASACLVRPGDSLVVYEIDPGVVRLAGPQGSLFTYVSECAPSARMAIGDARLRLAEEADGTFDVLVIDAFSSDAVPAHLLTREAVRMYMRKLKPNGVLILHLSNRNLALDEEAARVVAAEGLAGVLVSSGGSAATGPRADGISGFSALASSAMVIAQSQSTLDQLKLGHQNTHLTITPAANMPGAAWSDEYINLTRALSAELGAQWAASVTRVIERVFPKQEPEPAPPK